MLFRSGDTLEQGFLYSVAEFLEASVVNLEGERSTFWVEGEFPFDGFIHLSNSAALKERWGGMLDEFMRRSREGANLVRFADNVIDRLVVGGVDVTSALAALSQGEERGMAATEFGLGCADAEAAEPFGVNSLLHKSAGGAYIGIGKGLRIPHIDFIARGATIRFIPAAEG